MFKVKNGRTIGIFEIYSKLTMKASELRQRHRSGVFIVNFKQILLIVLKFLLLILNK